MASSQKGGWTNVTAVKTTKRKKPLAKRPAMPAPENLSIQATFVYEALLEQYPFVYLTPEDLLERLLRKGEDVSIEGVWSILDDELESVLVNVSKKGPPQYSIKLSN